MNKAALSFISAVILCLSVIQGFLPSAPLSASILVWVSAAIIFVTGILTAIQQYYNNNIDNKSIYQTAALLILGILGAINHFTQSVPIPPAVDQWLRFGFTVCIAVVNTYSETYFPANKPTP